MGLLREYINRDVPERVYEQLASEGDIYFKGEKCGSFFKDADKIGRAHV